MYQVETTVAGTTESPAESMCSAGDWVSLQLRREALERHVARDSHVLELDAGAGHFTLVLQRLGCRVSGLGAASVELASSHGHAAAHGESGPIAPGPERDIAALHGLADARYDAVVAYGGALSYALDRRDQVLAECRRVLRPGGVLVLDVLSLWGTLHRQLALVVGRDLVQNRAVIRSGNVRGANPECHLFRAAELESFLRRGGFTVLALSASSALSTGMPLPPASDPGTWSALLEYERAACTEPGYLDGGSRLIAVARR
jgi:SAM-dependent methyltransferase